MRAFIGSRLQGASNDARATARLDDLETRLLIHRERTDVIDLAPARRVDLAEDRIGLDRGHPPLPQVLQRRFEQCRRNAVALLVGRDDETDARADPRILLAFDVQEL